MLYMCADNHWLYIDSKIFQTVIKTLILYLHVLAALSRFAFLLANTVNSVASYITFLAD